MSTVGRVEGLAWHKSSFSGGNGNSCVEVAALADGERLVRDTKAQGRGPILRFPEGEWAAFVGGVNAGEFDLAE
ncbi:hypothetical protein BJF78_28465 [Pseudonocardia sp. CNS-139]|nr:hypothetical protein BJF78_28465 [Pseudonocardia sp. CNS-139]